MLALLALFACASAPDCQSTWYLDFDDDGYGGYLSVQSCEAPAGFVANDADCDDTDALAFPGGDEVPNGLDDDCSGVADDLAQTQDTGWAGKQTT